MYDHNSWTYLPQLLIGELFLAWVKNSKLSKSIMGKLQVKLGSQAGISINKKKLSLKKNHSYILSLRCNLILIIKQDIRIIYTLPISCQTAGPNGLNGGNID